MKEFFRTLESMPLLNISVSELVAESCREFYCEEAKLLKRKVRSRPSSPVKPRRGDEDSVEYEADDLTLYQKQVSRVIALLCSLI